MSPRFAISTATVVLLVVLRLNIGWHFFSEGVKHYADPNWTSEPVLRAATGPLAPMYHAYLPDFHGLETWLHGAGPEKESSAAQGFLDEIQADWDGYRQAFAMHYELSQAQQKRASQVLGEFQDRVRSWGGANRDALAAHVHQWRRTAATGARPDAADVPFQKGRVAQSKNELRAEAARWQAELAALERDYHNALAGLLTAEQRELAPPAREATAIDTVDTVMTYVILVIGALLLVGLFTRSACLAGAVFLFSVVLTQPFWVSESQPTFNQFVEMFALLTLATTHVGRWGLDFFVHQLLAGRESVKGPSDALDS